MIALIVWYWTFFAFPIFCFISILLTWFFIHENNKKKEPLPFKKYFHGISTVFKHEGKWLLTSYLAGAVCLFTLFGILFYLSDILEKIHSINGIKKGFFLAIPLLVMCTTSYITGSKIGINQSLMKKLIVIGLLLMTVSYAGLGFFHHIVPFISILMISSLGTGFVLPCINSFITNAVSNERRGFVTSLYGSVRFIGAAIGPPIFGRLMEWSKIGMFLSVAGLTLLTGILAFFFIKINKDTEKQKGKQKVPHLQPASES